MINLDVLQHKCHVRKKKVVLDQSFFLAVLGCHVGCLRTRISNQDKNNLIYMHQMLGPRFCLVDNSVYNFYALQRTNPRFGWESIVKFNDAL